MAGNSSRRLFTSEAGLTLRQATLLSLVPVDGARAYVISMNYLHRTGTAMSPQQLHTLLQRLRTRGLIDSDGSRGEKLYSITADGVKLLRTAKKFLTLIGDPNAPENDSRSALPSRSRSNGKPVR